MTARAASVRLLAAGLVAILLAAALHATGTLDRVEAESVDARFALRGDRPVDDIAVVAIDEATFTDLDATWPLQRTAHARVVDRLPEAGVRLIVYDVQFTEPSLDERDDLALYDAIDRAGGAVLATGESDEQGRTAVLGGDEALAAIDAEAGAINMPTDRGVVRRWSRRAGKLTAVPAVVARRLGRPLSPGDFDADGEAFIDFRGGPRTFRTLSFSDVHDGRFDRAALRGRIVVVGASAPTLQDVHPTATSGDAMMAGPEVQANAIWTALRGNPLRAAPEWTALLLIVLLGAAAPLAALRLMLRWVTLVAFGLAVALLAGAWLAFARGTVVPVVAPLLALGLSAAGTVIAGYLLTARARKRAEASSARLEREVLARTLQVREAQLELAFRLAEVAERRDHATGKHIDRMSQLCEEIALGLGWSDADAEMLRHASVLHDVGKVAIPDRVLLKPGKLDAEEWALMKTHTTVGAEMLSGSTSPLLQLAEQVALTHHERWDGGGYPHGLVGESIPIEGRIAAVCDVYDALTNERPYKRAWSVDEALDVIREERGRQFDPTVVDVFLRIVSPAGDRPAELAA